jgi:hypothetical protein
MTSNPGMGRRRPRRMLPRHAHRVVTVAACAVVALSAALPVAPALAAGTSQAVMVIGGSVVVLDSVSVNAGASPPSAAVTFDVTANDPLLQQLIQTAEAGTRLDVQIYVSSSGLGTDTTLSSALVTKVSESSAGGTSPLIASVSFAGETASACTGGDDSCAPKALPALQLASSANPATTGADVTFTATEPALRGAAQPGGTVSFTADNTALAGCTGVTLTGGQATCAASSLSAGDHVISAQYSGDTSYTASAASLTQTVNTPTPPALSLPPNQTAEATGPGGASVTYTATATDAQDGPLTPTCAPASGALFPLGIMQVNCSVTDSLGLSASGSFTVTVVDTTPPSLNLPGGITAEATGPAGATVSYTATATDLVDGPVPVNCTPASGSTFALDTTTPVTCTAADSSGNTSTGSFTVTVADTTPPSLKLPSDITAQATGPAGAAVSYTATATDLVDGSVPVSCTPASGSSFPVGTTTVSCSAADAHGNTTTGSFKVTVNYAWTGFFQPVDNPPTVNTVKAGSAVPVKFSLTGNQGLNIFQTGYPASAPYTCSATAPTDAIEQTVTAGASSLSYDPASDQYTYVWKTDKAWAGTCRALVVKLAGGATHTANFQFNK